MQTEEYISNDITPLALSNTITDARELFDDVNFTHLPVVEDGKFYGLIAEKSLVDFENNATFNDIQFSLESFFTIQNTVWLNLFKIFSLNDANLIPVLDHGSNYLGYYELSDILQFLSSTPFLGKEGSVLIVAKHPSEYSISEITQIVESNGAKLFGVFISEMNKNNVVVTLKLHSNNINDVIHTFRRYDYNIILGIEEDEYLDDLKKRSDYLKKYLSI